MQILFGFMTLMVAAATVLSAPLQSDQQQQQTLTQSAGSQQQNSQPSMAYQLAQTPSATVQVTLPQQPQQQTGYQQTQPMQQAQQQPNQQAQQSQQAYQQPQQSFGYGQPQQSNGQQAGQWSNQAQQGQMGQWPQQQPQQPIFYTYQTPNYQHAMMVVPQQQQQHSPQGQQLQQNWPLGFSCQPASAQALQTHPQPQPSPCPTGYVYIPLSPAKDSAASAKKLPATFRDSVDEVQAKLNAYRQAAETYINVAQQATAARDEQSAALKAKADAITKDAAIKGAADARYTNALQQHQNLVKQQSDASLAKSRAYSELIAALAHTETNAAKQANQPAPATNQPQTNGQQPMLVQVTQPQQQSPLQFQTQSPLLVSAQSASNSGQPGQAMITAQQQPQGPAPATQQTSAAQPLNQ